MHEDKAPTLDNRSTQPLVNGSRGVVIGFANITKYDEYGDYEFEIIDEGTESADDMLFPVVEFKCGRIKVIRVELFSSRVPEIGLCKREAIPLKLAWAVTIHKSQGMTLDYVKVDVRDVFTEAQTYVALSRVRDESGLELHGFSPEKVMADKKAVAFYKNPGADYPTWKVGWSFAKEAIKIDHDEKPISVPTPKKGCLTNITFVFTGEPVHISRIDAGNLVKDCGGFVRSTVSGKTNYLVIGNVFEDGRCVSQGEKYKKADQIRKGRNMSNLKIINENDLFDLIRKKSNPAANKKGLQLFGFFKKSN